MDGMRGPTRRRWLGFGVTVLVMIGIGFALDASGSGPRPPWGTAIFGFVSVLLGVAAGELTARRGRAGPR